LISRDSERKEDLLLKFPGAAPGSRVGFHGFNYIRYNDIFPSPKGRLESWAQEPELVLRSRASDGNA
jgi:hypothetical protein